METTEPCELIRMKDHFTVVLRPSLLQSSWSDVDLFGTEVRQELESRKHPTCVIDLSSLTYMGSSIVALIVRLWKDVQDRRGKFIVVCPHPSVAEVIRLAGLEKFWTVVPDIEKARKKLGLKSVLQSPQEMRETSVSHETTVSTVEISKTGSLLDGSSDLSLDVSNETPAVSGAPLESRSAIPSESNQVQRTTKVPASVNDSIPPSFRILYFTLGALTVVIVLVGILLFTSHAVTQ